jgi:hypothetical protein
MKNYFRFKSILLFFILFTSLHSVSLEKFKFSDYENSLLLTNGKIEMIILTDIGPRIIHFGFKGKQNMFYIDSQMLGKKGEVIWRNYGGHRLWIAPENKKTTYVPDNDPIKYYWNNKTLILLQEIPELELKKEIMIEMSESESKAKIIHRIQNYSESKIELAAWAITVLPKEGTAFLPISELGKHPEDLLATDSILLWKYSKLNDPRVSFQEREIIVKGDSKQKQPFKIGIKGKEGWNTLRYKKKGTSFTKTYKYFSQEEYVDLKASSQVFTNKKFIELETLSPLKKLNSNQVAEHIEFWELESY